MEPGPHHGGILKPATYSKLVSPRALVDGSPIRYSGGLSIHRAFGYRTIEHGGAIDGFLSNAAFYPDDDLLVVVRPWFRAAARLISPVLRGCTGAFGGEGS